ncbi:hypothetical protein C9I28_17215 [Pseudoduganella armeniaca]|uniref:Uncharacterized protein n=1 Tax=Pseudoduganella armeniaca TaxID=2072590 RepID=A0A2R4CC62_9BURK|nr:hypothetical protein C9I28_17215 [Pseudoduganella armeniaca]
MAALLTDAGIAVGDAESVRTPLIFPAICGAPTGQANRFTIRDEDLDRALALPAGFEPWLFDAERIDMYQPDGSIQCHPEAEPLSPQQAAARLREAGVTVMAERRDHLGQIPAVCGFPTGSINVVTIGAGDYTAARAAGWSLLSVHVASQGNPVIARAFGTLLDFQGVRLGKIAMPGPDGPGDPEGPRPWPMPPRLPDFEPVPSRPPLEWPGSRLPGWPPASGHAHRLLSELPGHVCRVIRPGDQVTLDLRWDRFNIQFDEHGVIESVGFY